MFNLCFAQTNDKQEKLRDNFIAFGAFYGTGVPIGELSERFGQHFLTGISFDYFNTTNNLIYSVQYEYLAGRNVNEDILEPLRLEDGNILSTNSGYALVLLRERGASLSFDVSKVIAIGHQHSGLKLGLGFGVLQHKIRILVDQGGVPQLEGDYKKGYDRFTIGPALKQIIGYQRVGTSQRINYSIQLEIIEGFTKNKRPFDFDLETINNQSRLDLVFNLVAKWYIPLSVRKQSEEIYY